MKGLSVQGRIGVLMGGVSAEREISLRTDEASTKALRQRGYDVCPIDVGYDMAQRLTTEGIRVACVALHGRLGEDGTVQDMLEMMRIPYSGSGAVASALSMDTIMSKRIFAANATPTPVSCVLGAAEGREEARGKLNFPLPLVVKPASEGSTIGVVIVHRKRGLTQAIDHARRYDRRLLLEHYVKGGELTLGGVNGEPLVIIEIAPKRRFHDYRAKYTVGETEYILPPRIPPSTGKEGERIGMEAYKALGCQGCARVDMMADEDGKIFVLEVNTMPGMAETSLVPKAAQCDGIHLPELVERILGEPL